MLTPFANLNPQAIISTYKTFSTSDRSIIYSFIPPHAREYLRGVCYMDLHHTSAAYQPPHPGNHLWKIPCWSCGGVGAVPSSGAVGVCRLPSTEEPGVVGVLLCLAEISSSFNYNGKKRRASYILWKWFTFLSFQSIKHSRTVYTITSLSELRTMGASPHLEALKFYDKRFLRFLYSYCDHR